MIKRLLILLLLAQAAAMLALAAGAQHRFGLSWPAGLALGFAGVVLLRLAISANNFAMSRRAGSVTPPAHALSPARAVGLFLHEFCSSMLATNWYMLRPIGLRLQAQARGLPVLLIHGYAGNSGYWHPMSKLLTRAGISHYGIDLEPPGAAIDDFAPQVHAALEHLRAQSGGKQVIIVGHSMGGLVARAYLRKYGDAHIARVVTLGTPHHGTALAHFGPGSNAAQMRRGSAWLDLLNASDANLQRELVCSIYSVHDNIIAPQDSSALPGARNLVFGAIGHVALGRHPEIMRCALNEIERVGLR